MATTKMVTRSEALAGRRWYLIDANGAVLGRVATKIANLLRGKTKPTFTPHQDAGDFVVVINAAGLKLSGEKLDGKLYYRHSGYPGGVRKWTARRELADQPERMLREAVRGMLPKNRLGRQLATKLKVYRDGDHPHSAQQPTPVTP
jgi:large subunit ribosomal protein L13